MPTTNPPAGTRTDIAVVGWAQSPMVRRTDLSETQLLLRVITDALGAARADPRRRGLHVPRLV